MHADHAPTVSFVIVNRPESAVARCVAGIRAQAGVDPRDVEIRVIDNGSTPASLSALEPLGVAMVASLRDPGLAAGANLGIARARGRHVALVDARAVLDAGWLAHGLAILERDPAVEAVGGGAEGDVLTLPGDALLIRAPALARLRGLDTAFTAHPETDLCARIWATGGRVVASAQMRTWRPPDAASRDGGFRERLDTHRDHLRLLARHLPDPGWRTGLRRAALALLVSGISRRAGTMRGVGAKERRARVVAGAWGLLSLPRLGRARRETIARGEHYAGFAAHAAREARADAAGGPGRGLGDAVMEDTGIEPVTSTLPA